MHIFERKIGLLVPILLAYTYPPHPPPSPHPAHPDSDSHPCIRVLAQWPVLTLRMVNNFEMQCYCFGHFLISGRRKSRTFLALLISLNLRSPVVEDFPRVSTEDRAMK